MSKDEHFTDSEKQEKWSRFCMLVDVAVMLYEEDQRRLLLSEKGEESKSVEERDKRIFYLFPRKTRTSLVKRTQQNPNGATTSSSSLLDLNKIPTVSETENPQNYVTSLNGASTSSSHLNVRCSESSLVLFDNNAAEYEKKTETKDPRNPNYQTPPSSCLTENTSRKRRAVSQRKRTCGFKKAKISPLLRPSRETPEWIFQVIRDMNGDAEEEPRLFFERSLSESDVKSSQSRLLIPFKKLIRNDFLTPKEFVAVKKEKIKKEDDDNIGVGTILVNQRSEKWGLRFKIWPMEKKDSGKGTLNYALNWGWNDVVKGNDLRENSKISLWTFRCRGVLCFVLEVRTKTE